MANPPSNANIDRLSVQVATQQDGDARLDRFALLVAKQEPADTRLDRFSIQVAVASTEFGGLRLEPPLITATTTVYEPEVVGPRYVAIQTLIDATVVQEPTVQGSALSVAPAFPFTLAHPFSPEVTGESGDEAQTVTPALIAAATVLHEPTLTTTVAVTPPLLSAGTVVGEPVVNAISTIEPPPIFDTTVNEPTLAASATIEPPTINNDATLYEPGVTITGVIIPPVVDASATLHEPSVAQEQFVVTDLISATSIFEPTITATISVQVPAISGTSVYAPELAASATIEMSTISGTVLYELGVAQTSVIEAGHITETALYDPTLTSSATIFTPPNPITTNVREPLVIREQFVSTSLLSISAVYGPTVTLAYDQTIFPSYVRADDYPYTTLSRVYEPGVGTYVPESHANPVYIYANVEVNQDVPADIGTDFVYIYANVGVNKANDADDNAIHYLYVNPVWFVKMPMIFLLSTAQPLEPGSGLSGWGILPAAVE
jgi:hypothetical protein